MGEWKQLAACEISWWSWVERGGSGSASPGSADRESATASSTSMSDSWRQRNLLRREVAV